MRIDGWMEDSTWRKSSACAWDARWPTITPSAGMEITGACHAKKSVRVCGVRRWKSNGVWMVPTGYASAAAISPCAIAQHPCARPQVLPTYGLLDSRNEEPNQETKSNPNTMCLPITPGGNHGTGHFYLAKNRTFLLCVDKECIGSSDAFRVRTALALSLCVRHAQDIPVRIIEPGYSQR
jgi:hypothetical protein